MNTRVRVSSPGFIGVTNLFEGKQLSSGGIDQWPGLGVFLQGRTDLASPARLRPVGAAGAAAQISRTGREPEGLNAVSGQISEHRLSRSGHEPPGRRGGAGTSPVTVRVSAGDETITDLTPGRRSGATGAPSTGAF